MGPGNSDRQVAGFDNDRLRGGFEAHGAMTGRLPASGREHDEITLERNRDYPADSDLCFGIGNAVTRVRLTGRDLHRLRAVLLDQGVGLEGLYERVRHLQAGAGAPSAGEFQNLVDAAHAAGYRLCAEDVRAAREDAGLVSDFLLGLYEAGAAPGEPWSADDQAAISRVRHLLES
jgi:hypothetical protein